MTRRRNEDRTTTTPAPTVGAARALLAKARAELPRDRRQASEKGWLAAVTAGRAMLRAAGEPWGSAKNVATRVRALEDARHMTRFVSRHLQLLAAGLHGHVFYVDGDDYPVEEGFDAVEDLIDHAAEFVRLRGKRRSA